MDDSCFISGVVCGVLYVFLTLDVWDTINCSSMIAVICIVPKAAEVIGPGRLWSTHFLVPVGHSSLVCRVLSSIR